jgi:hypothetical protein
MRCVRHVTVLFSALATLMLACSSPDSADVGPKTEAPTVGAPTGTGAGGGSSGGGAGIPMSDGGDGGIPPTDAGDGGVMTKEAGVSSSIQANVRFLLTSTSPSQTLLPNTSYDLTFEIEIHSSHDERFQLVPHIDAGWTAVVSGPDTIDATVASAIDGLTVTKVITVTTGAVGSGALVLDLEATHFPTFTQTSLPTALTIGMTPTIPDRAIQPISMIALGPAAFRTDTLFVPRQPGGGSVTLEALMIFAQAGGYQVSSPAASPSSDWTVQRASSATITTTAAGQTSMTAFKLTPKSSGGQYVAVDGDLSFTITSADGTHTLPFSARLRVVDVLP